MFLLKFSGNNYIELFIHNLKMQFIKMFSLISIKNNFKQDTQKRENLENSNPT